MAPIQGFRIWGHILTANLLVFTQIPALITANPPNPTFFSYLPTRHTHSPSRSHRLAFIWAWSIITGQCYRFLNSTRTDKPSFISPQIAIPRQSSSMILALMYPHLIARGRFSSVLSRHKLTLYRVPLLMRSHGTFHNGGRLCALSTNTARACRSRTLINNCSR